MQAIQYWVQNFPHQIHQRFDQDFIPKGTKFILKNNTFQFNNKQYKQISGTAMGTPFAPTYANLTMGYLEKTILSSKLLEIFNNEKRTYIEKNFFRYIDDCFITWTYGLDDLHKFETTLNEMNEAIKFTIETSTKTLPFLDILLSIQGKKNRE